MDKLKPCPLAEDLIKLFYEYRESFGLTNAEFPDMQPQDEQCEFEEKFCEAICKHTGHDFVPDQCGYWHHNYCYRCGAMEYPEISGLSCQEFNKIHGNMTPEQWAEKKTG